MRRNKRPSASRGEDPIGLAGGRRPQHSEDGADEPMARRHVSVILCNRRHLRIDQETGRWTQEDPIGLAGGINLYQFNGNDPATYDDPYGLKAGCDWFDQSDCIYAKIQVHVGRIGVGGRIGSGRASASVSPFGRISFATEIGENGIKPISVERATGFVADAGLQAGDLGVKGELECGLRDSEAPCQASVMAGGAVTGGLTGDGVTVEGRLPVGSVEVNLNLVGILKRVLKPVYDWAKPGLDRMVGPPSMR